MIVLFFRHRPHHPGELHLVPHHRRRAQQLLHHFPERLLMLAELLSAVEAVDLRHIGEAGLGIKNEVAEKALIERHRRRLAEHFTQCRQVVLATNDAQDIAFPQAGFPGEYPARRGRWAS